MCKAPFLWAKKEDNHIYCILKKILKKVKKRLAIIKDMCYYTTVRCESMA